MILGAHESIAGGCHLAFGRAAEHRGDALQLFVKNARGWQGKALSAEDVALFREAAAASPVRHSMAHASYLINVAAEPGPIRTRSLAALVDELSRCEALGIPGLVLHPGSHPDHVRGLALAAELLDEALGRVPGKVELWLENTAGQGACIGAEADELARLLSACGQHGRMGVCFDTCHAFAAGYDLRTEPAYRKTMKRFGDALGGLSTLRAFHLNDSKKGLGCRVDRHEVIGAGELGRAPFRFLLNDRRFARVPGVLETPEFERYGEQLAALRRLVRPSAAKKSSARLPG